MMIRTSKILMIRILITYKWSQSESNIERKFVGWYRKRWIMWSKQSRD